MACFGTAACIWSRLADDVDSYAQEILEILEQANVIKQRGPRLEIYEQVEITVWESLSPGGRAEYSYPAGLALLRDAEDFRAVAAQPFQGQHVLGYASKV